APPPPVAAAPPPPSAASASAASAASPPEASPPPSPGDRPARPAPGASPPPAGASSACGPRAAADPRRTRPRPRAPLPSPTPGRRARSPAQYAPTAGSTHTGARTRRGSSRDPTRRPAQRHHPAPQLVAVLVRQGPEDLRIRLVHLPRQHLDAADLLRLRLRRRPV